MSFQKYLEEGKQAINQFKCCQTFFSGSIWLLFMVWYVKVFGNYANQNYFLFLFV